MNDSRSIAQAAVARLTVVLDALASNPGSINAVLDVEQPLAAAFNAMSDTIDSIKSEIAEIKRHL